MNFLQQNSACLLALTTSAVTLTGCANFGIPTVDIDLGVAVSGRGGDGRTWRSTQQDFSREPVVPRATVKFPATVYSGKLFSWRFFAGDGAIGANVRSNLSVPICFRFDQARISSNMQPQATPLRVNWLRVNRQPVYPLKPTYGAAYSTTAHCFSQQFTRFDFGPEMEELFPNRSCSILS